MPHDLIQFDLIVCRYIDTCWLLFTPLIVMTFFLHTPSLPHHTPPWHANSPTWGNCCPYWSLQTWGNWRISRGSSMNTSTPVRKRTRGSVFFLSLQKEGDCLSLLYVCPFVGLLFHGACVFVSNWEVHSEVWWRNIVLPRRNIGSSLLHHSSTGRPKWVSATS